MVDMVEDVCASFPVRLDSCSGEASYLCEGDVKLERLRLLIGRGQSLITSRRRCE